jgi:hypothetical protein
VHQAATITALQHLRQQAADDAGALAVEGWRQAQPLRATNVSLISRQVVIAACEARCKRLGRYCITFCGLQTAAWL